MGKVQKIFAVVLIGLLQAIIGQLSANAQSSNGSYSITVNTPGTFGQVILQTVDNWSDVVELTVSGHLNSADMTYFSRLQNMTKLDLSQVDISIISGCKMLEVLQTVVLPESVTKIDDSAFWGCTSLSTINLDNITEIGVYSFTGCKALTDIKLTNLVTLGDNAFSSCFGLTNINLPNVTEIGNSAFKMDYYTNSMLTSVSVPNVRHIGSTAFRDCKKLQTIELPLCTNIGSNCFNGCNSLTSVTLSDNLTTIESSVFAFTDLKSIKLPSALKTIEDYAFQGAKLTEIDIPEGVISINSYAFERCPLECITLPSTLKYISDGAFDYDKEPYALKDVYCKSVVPIITNVFNNDMAKGATLHVPALSVSAYKLDEYWYKFNKIEAIEGELSDVTIVNPFTLIDYSGLANNANLTITSSDSQTSNAGHLSISGDKTLSLGNFIQHQNLSYENNYHYENGTYINYKTYLYCSTLIANNEVRANSVTTKIQLPIDEWTFLSLPYDVNVSDIVAPAGAMWVVRKYNGANRASMTGDTWENVNAGQTLEAGVGYIFHCINDSSDTRNSDLIEFEFPAVNNSNKNNVFSFNDVVKTINEYPAEFSHNRGWNLVGNPYPSYFKSHYIDFPAPITVWNGSGYTAYSLADDDYLLHPNEAFFVQCPLNTNQLRFLIDGRTHNYTTSPASTSRNSRSSGQSPNGRSIFNFILADDDYSDRTRLVLNEDASYDYEIERDASKFMSDNATVPQIYVIDNGIHYAIDERPIGTGEYTLGVRIGKEGNCTISLNSNTSDYDVLLTDKETGTTTNLATREYSFESAPKTINNRFTVKIVSKGEHSFIESATADKIGFTINGHKLSVGSSSAISVYSIDGKIIYNGIVEESIELNSGIYLLSIDNSVHKIVIK